MKITIPLVVLLVDAACVGAPRSAAEVKPAAAPPKVEPAEGEERFDYLVREDFFDGLRGDEAALARAIKVCDDTLARNPKHAEALVWHGAGMIALASRAFQSGDQQTGIQKWMLGMKEMDDAVALEPTHVGTLIPRGAVLLAVSAFVPDKARGRELLEKGVGDYQRVLAIQQPHFESLSMHARGQLLFGLADGSYRLGREDEAKAWFERLAREGAGTPYAERAQAWLAGEKDQKMSCGGCHSR